MGQALQGAGGGRRQRATGSGRWGARPSSRLGTRDCRPGAGQSLQHIAPRHPRRAGSWLRGLYILLTSTAQPGVLSLPFAMAGLGFAGGTIVLLVSGAWTLYCSLLVARLHHYGGRRYVHYRKLAKDVMSE